VFEYYALVEVPGATAEEPTGLFRVFRGDGRLYAEHVTGEGHWERDPALLTEIHSPSSVEISETDARKLLTKRGMTLEHVPVQTGP
jgi:hypothetical protein